MIGTKMKHYKIIVGLVCFAAVFGVSNAANAKAAKCEIAMIGWMGIRITSCVGPHRRPPEGCYKPREPATWAEISLAI